MLSFHKHRRSKETVLVALPPLIYAAVVFIISYNKRLLSVNVQSCKRVEHS